MRTPNVTELRELGEWAYAEWKKEQAGLPSEWYQGVWIDLTWRPQPTACRTVCCLAGKAALDHGWLPVAEIVGEGSGDVVRPNTLAEDGFEEDRVSRVAQDILGLDEYEAESLFDGALDIWDVFDLLDEITYGAIQRPADLGPRPVTLSSREQ